ncbi:hypothetical protein N9099_00365 [Mariniblastus sp.]|nr:hypothetical protein [Mariniblastus sp.]
MNMCFFSILSICLLNFLFNSSAVGTQDHTNRSTSQSGLLIELLDKRSNPIVAGRLVHIDKDSITISDGFGKNHEVQRRNLSKESAISIKNFESKKSVIETDKKKLGKLLPKIGSGSKSSQKNNLDAIMKFGRLASVATIPVSQIAKNNEDELGVIAFNTFLSICPKNIQSAEVMDQILARNRFLRHSVINAPEQYLKQLTEFKEICEDRIIFAAFHGHASFKNPALEDLIKPKDFLTTNGKENLIRSLAMRNLATLKSAKSQKSFFDVILIAEKRINGQFDQLTIHSAYIGCAQAGRKYTSTGKMMNFHNKYKHQLTREAQLWQSNYQQNLANSRETTRLKKSSTMKNFTNKRGDFLVRGEVEKIEQGIVIFLDHKLLRKTFRIGQFSTENQEFLNQK